MRQRMILNWPAIIASSAFVAFPVAASAATRPEPLPECKRVILFIIDGLAVAAPDEIEMPNLRRLSKQGCRYRAVHLPLPAHPRDDPSYPWSCSLPNPMLMAGTPFVGLPGIRNAMIQHQFPPEETAFIVNAYSYKDVSGGFGTYISKPHQPDSVTIDHACRVIASENPRFLRIHLQRPGIEGEKVAKDRYANEAFARNIWHAESPYRAACEKADEQLGRFIKWLAEQGLTDETTLFICGDHGQAKEGWHEPHAPGSAKTPLIVSGPNVRKGVTFAECEIFDLAPTMAALAGRESPQFSVGRVLREAFDATAPEPPKPLVPQLNAALRTFATLETAKQDRLRAAGFLTIDQTARWHVTDDGPAVVNRETLRKKWQTFVERQVTLIKDSAQTD
jgi:hypothetical protein